MDGVQYLKAKEPLRDSLLLTTKSQEFLVFISSTSSGWRLSFWIQDPWIMNPAPQTSGHCSPSLPSKNDHLPIAIKNYENPDIKVLWFLPTLLGFLLFTTYFCYNYRISIQHNTLDSLMCIYFHEEFTDPN